MSKGDPFGYPKYIKDKAAESTGSSSRHVMDRNRIDHGVERRIRAAASPPLYLLVLTYFPIGVALFITASRYYNYRHGGFDSISGALIGAATSYFSFRWYHPPINRGRGWSWEPRSPERAFGIGVGTARYIDSPETTGHGRGDDVEMGSVPTQEGRGIDREQAVMNQDRSNDAHTEG